MAHKKPVSSRFMIRTMADAFRPTGVYWTLWTLLWYDAVVLGCTPFGKGCWGVTEPFAF